MEEQEPLFEKVLHRLVKRHISGTTMSSAIEKAKELNSRNMAVAITFLSGAVTDKSKARYITTTYLELIRQISRLGIKASVQIPLEQLGMNVSRDTAIKNLQEIVAAGSKYGVFVWAEIDDTNIDISRGIDEGKRAFGIAFPSDDYKKYLKMYKQSRAVKLMFGGGAKKEKGYYKSLVKEVSKRDTINNCVLSSLPENALWPIVNNGIRKEKSLALEFGMGYSSRKLAKAMKKGAKVSMMVPFGKDWVRYATTNVPEGYMRFLAGRLLKE
ncbi:MAG: hypothetical protein KGH72_01415 [Candidatus Micrarchaeota archaeon]|nr:hypothetical protein [Candidatus Micrarchaeota archaeon]